MGLIGSALLAILGLLAAVAAATLSRLLAEDFSAWSHRMAEWLIQQAVRRLPEAYRDRLLDEWRGHLWETPGHLTKVLVTGGFYWAALELWRVERRRLRRAAVRERGLRLVEDTIADRYFSAIPVPFDGFARRVFPQRLRKSLAAEDITASHVITARAKQVADDLRKEVRTTVLSLEAALNVASDERDATVQSGEMLGDFWFTFSAVADLGECIRDPSIAAGNCQL